ncbi:hypothetical protein GCM10008961_01030 [Deinococcus knuensis]|uniref:Fido domain-containing protein n=1 Tax=Deinococcus knuensis TaxID=1837380 RepID=A0ABQ2SB47_9DEIO|nr:hypothetical protein GCM10008961_01030 [Deinococcus knuensis]
MPRYDYKHRGRKYPSPFFVYLLHDEILEAFGGTPGFKDRGQVESALAAPTRGVGPEDVYTTFFWKVAALGYLLIQNHGFSDANKRTALNVMEITLKWNGEYPKWSQETKTLIVKLVGAGHLSLEGLRYALLSACGYDVDHYNDLRHL